MGKENFDTVVEFIFVGNFQYDVAMLQWYRLFSANVVAYVLGAISLASCISRNNVGRVFKSCDDNLFELRLYLITTLVLLK